MAQEPNYYEILGVAPTSEDVVIQAAFKAMMRKYHPDINKSEDAEARAKLINSAYRTLSDPEQRRRYDALQRHREGSPRNEPPPPPRSADPSTHASVAGAIQTIAIGVTSVVVGLASVIIYLIVAISGIASRVFQRHAQNHRKAQASHPPPPPPPPPPGKPNGPEPKPSRTEVPLPVFLCILVALFFMPALVWTIVHWDAPRSPTPSVDRGGFSINTYNNNRIDDTPRDSHPPVSAPEEIQHIFPAEENSHTMGELADAITAGVNDFMTVYLETGIWGATAMSIDCHALARASQNILDTDRCAAFDFAAQYFDKSVSDLSGWPPSEYFSDRHTQLAQDYSRFSINRDTRLAVIRMDALGALAERAT